MTNKFLVSISSCFGASKSFLATTTPSINELVYVHDIDIFPVLFGISSLHKQMPGQQPGPEKVKNEQRLIMLTKFEIIKNRQLSPVHFQTVSYSQLLSCHRYKANLTSYGSTTPKKISYPNRLITPIFSISL